MIRKILISVIFIINIISVSAGNFYRSNSIFMVFEEIPFFKVSEYDWVLEIKNQGAVETRIIYYKGDIHSRIEYLSEGENFIIKEFSGENLVKVEKLKNGLLINEENYSNNLLINEYVYDWSGRQLEKKTFYENQLLKYEDFFILSKQGSIIQIRRLYSDGNWVSSGFSNTNDGDSNEWFGTDTKFLLFSYKDGKIIQIENWANGILNRSKNYIFTETETIVNEKNLINDKITEQLFDLNGKILSEISRTGNNIKKIIYIYDEDVLVQKDVSSSGLREKFLYEYGLDGNLELERKYSDNILIKEIYYNYGKKELEKLYKDNLLVLIVNYKDDEKLSEEIIK
jgi:hypothetical protein